jgi:dUTP pyrophosphatase
MLANPTDMIAQGFVKNLKDVNKQVQPNAIDFTVDQIQMIGDGTSEHDCIIGESKKEMAPQTPIAANMEGFFPLIANRSYDISSDMYVEVPAGYAAILVLRSTFVRNGMILASGLYDSGFKGNIGAVLHTNNANALVEKGVRIGQIMFVESNSHGVYAGGYNTADGIHWKDKA